MATTESATRSLVISCPTDGALNRVPGGRLGQNPKCGKCGHPLFQSRTLVLDSANFDLHASRSDLPLVIDFWAGWCQPCRMMSPAFEAAAALLEPRVRLGKLDTEAEQAIAARYRIQGIPCLIMISKGREIARTAGAMMTAGIVKWVEQALASI
ncbi:MAG: thioredoxin TrxC [Alphaproteobacteria bacterium]|nr:thioredoxin TrxC [Alphaproteobacteria bacterium]